MGQAGGRGPHLPAHAEEGDNQRVQLQGQQVRDDPDQAHAGGDEGPPGHEVQDLVQGAPNLSVEK